MIAEAFDEGWIESEGYQPVDDRVVVDVTLRSGIITFGRDALGLSWDSSDKISDITHWRLHKEDKYLEDAYDYGPTNPHGLPKAVCNVPMPPCKPSKPEKTNKVGRLSDEDILLAFNKLTGSNLSVDAYEMLLSLQEMFDSRS